MKKIIALLLVTTALIACNDVEQKADVKLQTAREAFRQGNYNEAKIQIDSIKLLYPKAFEARRAGIALMQQVEVAEQERTLHYLDSLQQVKHAELDSLRGGFVFEKDTAYQSLGNYFYPSQVVEKNLHRSFLRFQVDEQGAMSMTSIYCGSRSIHHTAVKVAIPDGSFAQTPASRDSYESTNLGEQIEKVDYRRGEDGDVIGFVGMNSDQTIRVTYLGERTFTTTMSADDRRAAKSLSRLSQLLTTLTHIRKEKEEANLKLEFVKRNMQQAADEAVP
ncbi:MAG: hypothetical protein LBL97_08900 [Prevotellaceae bacterium]|jgi:hypothetical protein|nr:hypothetical protein [Prevotellaceae bacterium]